MKLKKILVESIGGMVAMEAIGDFKGGSRGAKLSAIAKQIVQKEEDDAIMPREDLIKNVSEFSSYGPSIYKKHNLKEVGNMFIEISKACNKHVVEETADWFDRVTVQRNMNELKKQATQFHKIANEAQSLQDRMSALYEDMGNVLNRYFKINEEHEPGHDEDDEELNAGKNY